MRKKIKPTRAAKKRGVFRAHVEIDPFLNETTVLKSEIQELQRKLSVCQEVSEQRAVTISNMRGKFIESLVNDVRYRLFDCIDAITVKHEG